MPDQKVGKLALNPRIIELDPPDASITRGDNNPTPLTITVADLDPAVLVAHVMNEAGDAPDVNVPVTAAGSTANELKVTMKALVTAAPGKRNVAVRQGSAGDFYKKAGVTIV